MNPSENNWYRSKNAVISIVGLLLFAALLLGCLWYNQAVRSAEQEPDAAVSTVEDDHPASELTAEQEISIPN